LGDAPKATPQVPPFRGIRTPEYTYVEYATGERELYDLRQDPYQLDNRIEAANPEVLDELGRQLRMLKKCSDPTCRGKP